MTASSSRQPGSFLKLISLAHFSSQAHFSPRHSAKSSRPSFPSSQEPRPCVADAATAQPDAAPPLSLTKATRRLGRAGIPAAAPSIHRD